MGGRAMKTSRHAQDQTSLVKGNHRTAHGAARVRSLTETAAEMFLKQGYDAVSLDTLIARVGGSRRNIYGRFGGKEGLFIAVITQLCADLLRTLTELEIRNEDEHTALKLFGESVLDIILQPRALALHRLMIAEGARVPKVAQAIYRAGPDKAGNILSLWVDARQAAGRLRKDFTARELADKFFTLLVARPQLRASVGLDATPLAAAVRAKLTLKAVDMFLYGALAEAGTKPGRQRKRRA
jgi:AcrR family transcriptional regulator